jgi:hypothetical protein
MVFVVRVFVKIAGFGFTLALAGSYLTKFNGGVNTAFSVHGMHTRIPVNTYLLLIIK